jgi:hypothetical protein
MTRGAFSGTIEIGFTFLDVAGLQVRNIDAAAAARLGIQLFGLVANEGNEIVDLRDGKFGERRHALLDPTIVDYRANPVSADVAGHQTRTRQVGTGFAAGGIAPVTEGAIARKKRLATLRRGLRGWIGFLR